MTRKMITAVTMMLGSLGVVVYTGCKSKCGTATCQNGGTCQNNICTCPTGYTGHNCQSGWSDPAIGTYKCTRSNCVPASTGVGSWTSSVTKGSTNGGFTINISNFDNTGKTLVANIDSAIGGVNKIVVSQPSGSYGINATGTCANGTINLHFTTSSPSGGAGYTCNMVMVKQ